MSTIGEGFRTSVVVIFDVTEGLILSKGQHSCFVNMVADLESRFLVYHGADFRNFGWNPRMLLPSGQTGLCSWKLRSADSITYIL